MTGDIDPALLISLIVLVVLIGFVAWRFGVRREAPRPDDEIGFRAPGYQDNLTLIDGIGATLEGRLNALGITSFRQIAELTENDIARVNEVLRFKGRIKRENWVAQARELAEAGPRPAHPGGARKRALRNASPVHRPTKKKTTGKDRGRSSRKTARKTAAKTSGKSTKTSRKN